MRLALSRSRGCGSRERIIAVRAKPTIGFSSGNGATSGRRVKPMARRAGATISSALQIVGVSQARRASRLLASGRFGIGVSRSGFVAQAYGQRRRLARAFPPRRFNASSLEIREDADEL